MCVVFFSRPDSYQVVHALLKASDLWFCLFQVGGKKFEQSMKNVDEFVNKLCSSLSDLGFKRTVAFIDENFTAYEK